MKKSHYIALGLVALLVLVVLNLPARTAARLKLAVGSLFLPLFGLASASQQAAGKTADTLTPRGELERQNEALRRENQMLRAQELQHADLAKENERLRALVNWQRRAPWKLKLARVVLRDPANWWRTVQIDAGSRDGVRENMPVLTAEGLVGRVQSVSLTRAQVVLVGDPNCKVSARVRETRDDGIVAAGGPFDSSLVEFTHLERGANLKAGQNVETSGMGGIFTNGIPIGKIVDVRPAQFGLYTEARVKLNANLAGLDEVFVMIP
ncbi:MAG: rod shape-determining protein MreC [Pedosphaera sp.]|nr:rod shape-determining protein MreC [Pedosphaera sp.]